VRYPLAIFPLFFGVALYGASPALACSCEEDLTPVGLEDLERFDLIFSGVARSERRHGEHQCGSPDEAEIAWEVETNSVWRGDLARREVVLSTQDSCSPTVPLDDEIVFYAVRQGDGTAMLGGLVCRNQLSADELSQLLGDPSTTDLDTAPPECFPSCASGAHEGFGFTPLFLIGLWSLTRGVRRGASHHEVMV
jgi:hypothetical protein